MYCLLVICMSCVDFITPVYCSLGCIAPPEDHHQEVEQPRRQVPDHQPVHAHEGADGVVRDVEHREDDVGEGEEEARQQEDDHSHQHPLPHHVGLGIKLLTLCR